MRWLLLVTLAGCKFSPDQAAGDDAVIKDAPDDATPDTPPDAFDPLCYGGGAFYFCLPAPPPGPVTLADGDLDTTACTASGAAPAQIGGIAVCLLHATTLTVAGNVGIFGSKPLVLVASTTLTVDSNGSLDASSGVTAMFPGPGSDPSDCVGTTIDGTAGGNGGGGGAGGSFGTPGGNGGTGNAGAGGTASDAATLPITKLRGGCMGGVGAPGGGDRAVPGRGGGVVFLAAHETIAVNGVINASGAGGEGGNTSKGGGAGGGSGGLIVFHAATLSVSLGARIVANGGGGGAGAGQGQVGANGADPDATMPAMPAPGGTTSTGGATPGGNGAALASQPGNGNNGGGGGGGGGGGSGVIRVLAGGTIPVSVVSPPPG
ncbi:MAG: hypothetical protein ABI867_39760 [Kofleriaceae bacterium]